MDVNEEESDAREFVKSFRTDLFDEEVFVFTPKGEVKTLPAGATPIDFAYAVHTDVGHRTVGSKVNGRIVPLHYKLKSGDRVEVLTSKSGRGPSRDWLSLAASSRARNKIRQFFSREQKEDLEAKGRDALENALKAQSLPYRKLAGSAVLAGVIRESGYKKAEDFYLALGSGKLTAGSIVNKVLQRLKVEQVAEEEAVLPRKKPRARDAHLEQHVRDQRRRRRGRARPAREVLHAGAGRRDRRLHLARQGHHGASRRLPERARADAQPGALHAGRVGRRPTSESFRVQIAVDSWDRPRLLEDVARTFAEHGANIVSYGGIVEDQMAKNWYVAAGRRPEVAAHAADGAPQRRRGLRRVPRHAELGRSQSLVRGTLDRVERGTPKGGYAAMRPLTEPRRSLERGIGRASARTLDRGIDTKRGAE